jgi:hypothetical protein
MIGPACDRVRAIYNGSDGEATQHLFAELIELGNPGLVAVELFRAEKASERAKLYGRRFKGVAYDKKQWAMGNLCQALAVHGAPLGLAYGWGEDVAQPYHRWVLYVELPSGQVSFHTASRGDGPDYPSAWDGAAGMSPARIVRWIATLLGDNIDDELPDMSIGAPAQRPKHKIRARATEAPKLAGAYQRSLF